LTVEFRILGPLEAWEGGAPVALGGTKQRALLALFLLHANEVIVTERLIDALWEQPPANATKAVQVHVSRLRKALGGTMPTSRPPGYRLELSLEQLDVARFRRLRDEARRNPETAADRLEEALALWRGPALAEFADEPFARAERLRLEEERLEVLEERIDADLALARHAGLIGELEALVATYPLRERLRVRLMLALYRCGRQAEALAVYREGRRKLVEELGIEPGRALQELQQRILRQETALELTTRTLEMDAPAPAQRTAPRPPSPPPAEVREERKLVSVLFVELVGTAAARSADPEEVRTALQHFHAGVRREVERFGGSIESLIGETVTAVFGAPVAHEDDPERAARAALEIRRWIGARDAGMSVRMGVATGMALVSRGARPEGETLTAGAVVSAAQRLQAAAPVNAILVGEQTYRATREVIDYREADPIAGTGEPEGLPGWQVLTALPRRGFDLVREPRTRFVGRRLELELLVSTLARAIEVRSAQLVTLVGVPGIGKSRLVFELSKVLEQDREQIIWRQGRSLSYGDGVSFWALGEIVKTHAGILDSDSTEQAEEKLGAAVAALPIAEDETAWVERELGPLIGTVAEDRLAEAPGDRFAAWRRFLEGVAEVKPLVLVLEDLHWADDGLLEFVDELADRARDTPLLILCTTRPELLERRPAWGGGKTNALTISLAPLSEAETEQLFTAMLEQTAQQPEVHEALHARAAGNPLYAEQFARVLGELGSLEQVPETVHGIIAARLDGLSLADKAVLQNAAVVGKVFWPGALSAISDLPRGEAQDQLVGLERREFVRQARRSAVAGEPEYSFRHILLCDVAYEQIPHAARGGKHRRAAAWIESLGRPDDHAEMLAHHYLKALQYGRATGQEDPTLAESARLALRTAGQRAFALASYAAAARFCCAALELWPESDRQRVWLLAEAGRAKHAADGTGIDLLKQAFAELQTRGDLVLAAEVAVEIARSFWLGGDRDQAYAYIDRALELSDEHPGSRARAYALVERAAYHMNASDNAQATRLAREALQLTERLGVDETRIRALDVLGSSRAFTGDVAGIDDSKQAIAFAREHRAFSRLIVAQLNLHCQHYFLGQMDAAADALRAARQDVDKHGTADQRNWLRVAEAHQAILDGRWDEASESLDARIAEAETGHAHYLDPTCHALRAAIALARGQLHPAATESDKALDQARKIKDPQLLAPALALRATILLAQGHKKQAATLASELLARGHMLVPALLELHGAVTPIEFAWLVRDLGQEAELLSALESAPPTPWLQAARAIAEHDLTGSVNIVAQIGAPASDAYARLRAAADLVRVGRDHDAQELLAPVLTFYRKVGATRYLTQANNCSLERPNDR
jgi:DNA-binding SARP family transcriptional activator